MNLDDHTTSNDTSSISPRKTDLKYPENTNKNNSHLSAPLLAPPPPFPG